MAELAKGRMRAKLPLLEQALTGLMRDHHRRLLAWQLAHIDFLDEQIDTLSGEVTRCLGELEAEAPPPPDLDGATGGAGDAPGPPMPFTQAVAVLDTIPGWTNGAQSCWWPSGAPTCGALAQPVACRPGRA
jgi:transposase